MKNEEVDVRTLEELQSKHRTRIERILNGDCPNDLKLKMVRDELRFYNKTRWCFSKNKP